MLLRKLIGKLTGRKVVYIQDFNGETHERLSWTKNGQLYCYHFRNFPNRIVRLLNNGRTEGEIYVKKWAENLEDLI